MQNELDPTFVDAAGDLQDRYGADAVVIARMLAFGGANPEVSAFWSGVMAVLEQSDETAQRRP